MSNKLRLIILAAGKGTRMKSGLPKVLHLLRGKPMILHVLTTVLRLQAEKIYIIVGYKSGLIRKVIKEKLDKSEYNKIRFVKQERLLGTADAVKSVIPHLKKYTGNIIILCGDTPLITVSTINKLIARHIENNNSLTVLTADLPNPYGYGRIIYNQPGYASQIKEELDLSPEEKNIKEINSGIYCINSGNLVKSINKIKKNPVKKEYYLTDMVKILSDSGKKAGTLKIKNIQEIFGINTKNELDKLNN